MDATVKFLLQSEKAVAAVRLNELKKKQFFGKLAKDAKKLGAENANYQLMVHEAERQIEILEQVLREIRAKLKSANVVGTT